MIRKAWTAYAAAFTAIVLSGEAINLVQGGSLDVRTFGNWIVSAVMLAATWGYALRRRLGAHYYWRAACWVVIGATLATTIPAALAGDAARYVTFVSLLLVLPAFYASYRYAYHSPDIWPREESPP